MDEAFKGRDTIDYVTKAVDCFQTCNVAESEDIQEEDEEMLRLCIRKISKGLYAKHSRLSFIQGCIINLAGAYEPRLVFYVHAKGYIPIDEDPFEKSYEGIPVSVQEGSFVPFGKHATDFHDHIRMGCQIDGIYYLNTWCFFGTQFVRKMWHHMCPRINGRTPSAFVYKEKWKYSTLKPCH
ncbi:hypothetical protein DPMN_126447 [Dreissena polymorpha]|uniref:Uncharacterized protein n=1 Tax=Dreissena polymorpha TaxID=45954 RepID=A0A9D4GZJ0_DREPO|nr:hypothetical protein DPMN_126447 [Dreissena polymorpha]